MFYFWKIAAAFLAAFLIIGCQSTVRFSSQNIQSVGDKPYTENLTANDYVQSYDFSSLSDIRRQILKYADSYLGYPYCYGGYSSSCFDCSGFVKTVYGSVNIDLPRISGDIYNEGINISKQVALPGDLVFFSEANKVNHVGIYYGKNVMIHASSSKGVIRQSLDDDYFKSRIMGFRKYVD